MFGPVLAVRHLEPGVEPAVEPAVEPVEGETTAPEMTIMPVCEPQPPVGVPSADAAEAAARELLASLGIDVAKYEFEVYADEWNASVSGFLVLDGVRSNLSVNVGFGENGAVTWAGGFLATAQRGADYPRIGVDAAITRLNDQANAWMTGYGSALTDIARVDTSSEAGDAGAAGGECAENERAVRDGFVARHANPTLEGGGSGGCEGFWVGLFQGVLNEALPGGLGQDAARPAPD
jgi:hypothetical protein